MPKQPGNAIIMRERIRLPGQNRLYADEFGRRGRFFPAEREDMSFPLVMREEKGKFQIAEKQFSSDERKMEKGVFQRSARPFRGAFPRRPVSEKVLAIPDFRTLFGRKAKENFFVIDFPVHRLRVDPDVDV